VLCAVLRRQSTQRTSTWRSRSVWSNSTHRNTSSTFSCVTVHAWCTSCGGASGCSPTASRGVYSAWTPSARCSRPTAALICKFSRRSSWTRFSMCAQCTAGRCVRSFVGTHGCLPRQMCDPACISEDQKHGIFVIDDVLEFGDAGAAKHLPRFVKILSAGAAHDAPAVAQAAVYGLGVAAVTMGPAFAPFANDAVQVCLRAALLWL